ncbi:hypothetical protein GCM10010383_66120 [Streptomyces lomondensis]|uniref:Uncharacterized protein n=1 Tax=Streptomyces lomondensis TaxID=68229 RepID=A0ABQ2XPK9_9ACTN|nr:hypothetical protein GCM10010383_66120 [Streptomyces lomondensis]
MLLVLVELLPALDDELDELDEPESEDDEELDDFEDDAGALLDEEPRLSFR